MKPLMRPVALGGLLLLLPVLAVMGLRAHFDQMREEREAGFHRDFVLDGAFDRRKPIGLEARVLLQTDQGSYDEPADRPSFREHIARLGKLPVILDIAGCGFPSWLKGVPNNIAMLTVDENTEVLNRPTTIEACDARDANSLDRALKERLNFLLDYIDSANWIDKNRIMVSGSGEAAPIVAAYDGRAKLRMTIGDPCVIRWQSVSASSPMTMLFTDRPQGLAPGGDEPPQDLKAFERGAGPPPPAVDACTGFARPNFPSQTVVVGPGRLGVFERPEALLAAQSAAYRAL